MSVEQTNEVDAVGIDRRTGKVILTVSDHLPWDRDEHVLLLQEKLNRYLGFIEGGDLQAQFPAAEGRKVQITILFKYAPSTLGQEFLLRATEALRTVGIELLQNVVAH